MDEARKMIKEMGYRMSARRKYLGLTQEVVAELADVSPQLISNAENGERAISADKLYRISRALQTSADYLLCGNTTEKDCSILSNKLLSATPDQLQAIDSIIDIIMKL